MNIKMNKKVVTTRIAKEDIPVVATKEVVEGLESLLSNVIEVVSVSSEHPRISCVKFSRYDDKTFSCGVYGEKDDKGDYHFLSECYADLSLKEILAPAEDLVGMKKGYEALSGLMEISSFDSIEADVTWAENGASFSNVVITVLEVESSL